MLSQNNNALGIIFPNSYDTTVPELVTERAMASIPFAGRYRMVDFVLSSMANCGISNVSIVVRKNYHSLMDHLGTGREWDMARRHGGLNIVPPFAEKGVRIYSGRVEALGSILNFLENQKERYVVMSDANIAINYDFNALLAAHQASGADVTIAYQKTEIPEGRKNDNYTLTVDADGRVTDPAAAGFDGEENITGTSDALNTDAIMNLIVAANPGIDTIGLLYDLSQDASTQAIADAKAFCDANGIKYIEKNGTTTAEVQMAAEALIAAGVKAVFTPTDNTVMTAELSIYETFTEAGVQHYTGADSFALNGAFVGYGVDYVQLGEATADMVAELLCEGKTTADLPYQTFDNGIVTINTETCEALGLDLDTVKEAFKPYCTEIVEVTTAENFS